MVCDKFLWLISVKLYWKRMYVVLHCSLSQVHSGKLEVFKELRVLRECQKYLLSGVVGDLQTALEELSTRSDNYNVIFNTLFIIRNEVREGENLSISPIWYMNYGTSFPPEEICYIIWLQMLALFSAKSTPLITRVDDQKPCKTAINFFMSK